jgi:NTE family protein
MESKNIERTPKIKVGLALGGGSALGLAHIGVLKAFREHNVPIHCISGTSAGAIAAACQAFGISIEEMMDQAKNLSWFSLSKFSYSRMGLTTTKMIGTLIKDVIGDVNIEDAKIPLAIVAADLETGEPVVFTKGNLAEAIMASVSIPGLFVPPEIDGRQLVDGGVVENLPLSPLIAMGAELKIGVNLARWRSYKKPTNLIGVMLNAMDMMTHKQTNLAAKTADIAIEPRLEGFSPSDFKKRDELIDAGYQAAIHVMPQLEKALQTSLKRKKDFLDRFYDWLTAD